MSKLILIADTTGNYWVNPDSIVAVTEDLEGNFGCVIYTVNPEIVIKLRMSIGEVLASLNR